MPTSSNAGATVTAEDINAALDLLTNPQNAYLIEEHRMPSITFEHADAAMRSQGNGICIRDLGASEEYLITMVQNASDTVFHGTNVGRRIDLQIMWPGYPEHLVTRKHAIQVDSKTFTRAKLAYKVHFAVYTFIQEISRNRIPTTQPEYSLGVNGNIEGSQIYLVAIKNVADNLWQPVFDIERRGVPRTRIGG